MKKNILVVIAGLLPYVLGACSSSQYTPPSVIEMPPDAYTQIVDRSFDSTWSTCIQYLGVSRFHIDNFEKASGLITLSFTSADPSELVTGGHVESKGSKVFSGDYVDFLKETADAYLQGTMNIIVVPITADRTRVSAKASYTLTATIDNWTYTWSFDTGGSDRRFISNGITSGRYDHSHADIQNRKGDTQFDQQGEGAAGQMVGETISHDRIPAI